MEFSSPSELSFELEIYNYLLEIDHELLVSGEVGAFFEAEVIFWPDHDLVSLSHSSVQLMPSSTRLHHSQQPQLARQLEGVLDCQEFQLAGRIELSVDGLQPRRGIVGEEGVSVVIRVYYVGMRLCFDLHPEISISRQTDFFVIAVAGSFSHSVDPNSGLLSSLPRAQGWEAN